MPDQRPESPHVSPDAGTPVADFDETLLRAIDAGRLDPALAADAKLLGAFAAHQKLESLFAACVAAANSHSRRERARVTSGSEAIALAPYYQPNVVLIDIELPDMNGWELAERLPSGSLLIALTAHSEDDDFKRSTRAGIQYHLVKPVFQRQLRELLERVDGRPP